MLETVPLSKPLALFKDYSPNEIRRKDIARLRDTPILDWDAQPLPLPLIKRADQKCEVHTINELEARLREGYFAATTRDMRVQGNYYELAKTILIAAQLAAESKASFVDAPFVSVGSIELMPAHVLHVLDELNDGDIRQVGKDDRTIGELVAANECNVTQNDKLTLAVERDLRVFSMEVLRADLNGDGVKDILVHQAFQVLGGTMSWTSHCILTRASNDGLFERVPISLG